MIEIRKIKCNGTDHNAECNVVLTNEGKRLYTWFKTQYRYWGTFVRNDIAKAGWSEWQDVKIVEAE